MKKMKLKFILFCLFSSAFSYAQEVDYSKIIYPDSVEVPNFEERLVQLAWKNTPANRTYESEVYIA